MTSEDYFNWAAEYRQDAEAIEECIRKKEKLLKGNLKTTERQAAEMALINYLESRCQCLSIAKELEEIAAAIREKEG